MTKKVFSVLAYLVIGIYFSLQILLAYKIQYTLNDSWFWNSLSFVIPFLLCVDFVLIIVFLFTTKRWLSLIPLFFLISSNKWVKETIQVSLPIENTPSNHSFTLLSFNVGSFKNDKAFYGYNKIDISQLQDVEKLISAENPDIICFQEFHQYTLDSISLYKYFQEKYHYPYHFHKLNDSVTQKNALCGPIIYSKFPIEGIFYRELNQPQPGMNRITAVDVFRGQDTFRLFNVHFKSLSIRVDENQDIEHQLQSAQLIYQKVKAGFSLHKQNSHLLDSLLQKSNNPTIVCGDLNSVPYQYPYQVLRKKLKNTFEEKGNGLGFTLNRFPYFIRLDQVFVTDDFNVLSHKVNSKVKYLDHHPILVKLELKP